MRKILLLPISIIALSGCGSTGNKNDLQTVNTNLRQALAAQKQENSELLANNTLLNKKIDNLNQVIAVLDTEKSSRVQESTVLRGQVRNFVQNEIDALKAFLVEGDLLDYVGDELVERINLDEKPITIVDLSNRMPSAGVLTGVGAYVTRPTAMKVKVLRYIESNLVTVWESSVITMDTTGPNRLQFNNTVGVEKGDVIAYEFTATPGVGYSTGTGSSRYSNQPLALGSNIQVSSLMGTNQKRAYSMGVFGLLNQ
ncbi:hypothetical protein [Colwellia sp. MEBiC06753]